MTRFLAMLAFGVLAQPLWANDLQRISVAAHASFEKMPNVQIVDEIVGNCGAEANVSDRAAYCTSSNTIFVIPQTGAAYAVAHAFGHAVQVKHGVADVALRTIRARRAEEVKLRGYVDRQVDCVAGFLFHQAGISQTQLNTVFDADPFDDVHWGRFPLKVGPVMPVPLADRDQWFEIGQRGDLAACAVGEFGSELLIAAYKG